MNDRLKFRVWNDISNDFVDGKLDNDGFFQLDMFSFEEKHGDDWDHITDDGVNIIEQCTGLKDMNGNFIYENDIVVWNDGGGEVELKPKEGHVRIARVQLFPDLHFKLVGGYPKGTYTMGEEFHFGNFIYKNTEKYLKIVGNIHENKELLNER